jgi:hypothetical protein
MYIAGAAPDAFVHKIQSFEPAAQLFDEAARLDCRVALLQHEPADGGFHTC